MAIHNSLVLGKRVRGTFGKQITFTHYKGLPIAKVRSIPTYQNTPAQQKSRDAFKFLIDEWNNPKRDAFSHWTYYCLGLLGHKRMTPLNKFLSIYMPIILAGHEPVFAYKTRFWDEGNKLFGYGYVNCDQEFWYAKLDERLRPFGFFKIQPVNKYWEYEGFSHHSPRAGKCVGGIIIMAFMAVCWLFDVAFQQEWTFPYPWVPPGRRYQPYWIIKQGIPRYYVRGISPPPP